MIVVKKEREKTGGAVFAKKGKERSEMQRKEVLTVSSVIVALKHRELDT